MRNRLQLGVVAAAFITAATAGSFQAHAQSLLAPPETGFSGFLTVLGGYASVKSQFNTDGENRETSSLNSSGQTVNSFVVAPLFELAYAVSDWRTQFYVGLPIENIREGTFFQQEVGVRHWLADGTRLAAAILPMPVIAQRTWQDPFVTDEGRKRTDIDSIGVKLDAERILQSNFGFRYQFVRRTIDKEDSGQFLRDGPDATLTSSDVRNLRRNADIHQATVSYTYSVNRSLFLRPALRYSYADANGGSNSFQAVRPEAGVFYRMDNFDTSLSLIYQHSWFNQDNPIYDEKRDSNDYSAVFLLGYKQPFGIKSLRTDFISAVAYSDSEINFYDTRLLFVGVGATYTF